MPNVEEVKIIFFFIYYFYHSFQQIKKRDLCSKSIDSWSRQPSDEDNAKTHMGQTYQSFNDQWPIAFNYW